MIIIQLPRFEKRWNRNLDNKENGTPKNQASKIQANSDARRRQKSWESFFSLEKNTGFQKKPISKLNPNQ